MDRPDEETRELKGRLLGPRPQARFACLKVLTGSAAGRLFRVEGSAAHLGRGPQNDLVLEDTGVSRVHARVQRRPDGQVLLTDLDSKNGTTVAGQPVTERVLRDGDQIVLGQVVVVKFNYLDDLEEGLLQRLYAEARQDALTGILSRRAWLERFQAEIDQARAGGNPLTAALMDADHFKRINDTYGHPAGDAVLQELTRRVGEALDPRHHLGRYGGEEFAVLLPEMSLPAAREVLERARLRVCSEPFRVPSARGEQSLNVSISIGLAALGPEDTGELLLQAVDQALYQAKSWGRNRLVQTGDPPPRGLAPEPKPETALAGLMEQRRAPRMSCAHEVVCVLNGLRLPARLVDVARDGLRLEIAHPLPVDASVTLEGPSHLQGEAVRARVVWSQRSGSMCLAGLSCEGGQRSWLGPILATLGQNVVPPDERRRHVRIPVELPARLLCGDEELSVNLANLSAGGALAVSTKGLSAGTRVVLVIEAPPGSTAERAGGKTHWRAHVAYAFWQGGKCQLGLAFRLTTEQALHLQELLKACQGG